MSNENERRAPSEHAPAPPVSLGPSGTNASNLFAGYAITQTLAIVGYLCASPETWSGVLWQSVVGWASAVALAMVVRQRRLPGALGWYLCALAVGLNSSGIVVDHLIAVPGLKLKDPS